MYQNCCKKCGSIDLFTKQNGNNTGLYCSDCGAWIKWLGKDELRAYENSKTEAKAEDVKVVAKCKNYDPYAAGYEDGEKAKIEQLRQLLSNLQCNGITEYGEGYNDCIKDIWDIIKQSN